MTKFENLQLRLARRAAEEAEKRWIEHKRDCPKCSSALRSRKPAEMCPRGFRLYSWRGESAAILVEERRLAELPFPGQDELFSESEVVVSRRTGGATGNSL